MNTDINELLAELDRAYLHVKDRVFTVSPIVNAWPTIRAEIARLQAEAETSFQDGNDHGVHALCEQINAILDGKPLAGTCVEPWESTRQRIARLQAELAAAREAVPALQECYQWLDDNRMRIHSTDCSVHIPDARCSCGLHRVLTDICGVKNDLDAIRERGKP
jgi:uncharacterized small protein (DUF1192 family)